MGRKKTYWTPETLATRWCVDYHVGNWVQRKDGSYACRTCNTESNRRYIADKKGVEVTPSATSVETLRSNVKGLESALAVARERLRIAEEIEKLKSAYESL
jgi:hypothetical protein